MSSSILLCRQPTDPSVLWETVRSTHKAPLPGTYPDSAARMILRQPGEVKVACCIPGQERNLCLGVKMAPKPNLYSKTGYTYRTAPCCRCGWAGVRLKATQPNGPRRASGNDSFRSVLSQFPIIGENRNMATCEQHHELLLARVRRRWRQRRQFWHEKPPNSV